MKKEQIGIVMEVSGKMAKVRVGRHSDCSNCGACPGQNAIILDMQNPIEAKVGQRVSFEAKETNMLKAAFIVYLMPLIAIFLGVALGAVLADKVNMNVQLLETIGGVIAFILSVIYIKYFDKSVHNNSKMQPIITKILS